MPKIFDQARMQKPRMSAFDLSREQKLSCDMGELVPTYLDEVVPGDQFSVKSEIMIRLAPMLAPIMHRVNVYMHYFFVPNRIVWNQWEDFITGGSDGLSAPVFPTAALSNADSLTGTLRDYMGLPSFGSGPEGMVVSMLPFRAYQLIWNEYYRDQTFQEEIDVNTASASELTTLRKRAWEKDYFTSALPWAQRGAEIEAEMKLRDRSIIRADNDDVADIADNQEIMTDLISSGNFGLKSVDPVATDATLIIDSIEGLDINELRRSTSLQRWLERQARGGARYIETIQSHFGVKPKDYRLQRPEYLGGGRQPVVISEVLNTSATATEPQGEMTGHGISVGDLNTFKYTFDEHGYVMGILSVLPKTAYQQGVPRHYWRKDKFDFYWPELAHLGEQEILNQEVFHDVDDADWNAATFGYQQRWAEYKYGCSTVHGDFRNSLDFWHMGRIFATRPALNEDFIESDPTNRIWAVQDEDHLWIQLYHDVKARRPMPYFSDPRL